MPSYNITLNSKFNPFSYQEMLAPVQAATEAHQAIEEELGNLESKASVWEKMANEQSDHYAHSIYKKYADDLKIKADQLANEGLSALSRKGMLDMRTRYNKEIVPIENAYKRRETLAEEQRKAELANPTMLWQRRANEMSLDDLMRNPSADYGRSVSGAALTAQVATAAGALAKEFRDNPQKLIDLVGGDYYEYIKERGFSSEAILDVIMNNENASPVLTSIVESVINSSGIRDWNNAYALQQAYNYANQGLWQAVGQSDAQIVQNWRAQENLSHSLAMARQRSNSGSRSGGRGDGSNGGDGNKEQEELYKLNEHGVYSKGEDGKLTDVTEQFDVNRSYKGVWSDYDSLPLTQQEMAEKIVGSQNVRGYKWRAWYSKKSNTPHVEYIPKKAPAKLGSRDKEEVGNNLGDMDAYPG